MASFCTKCGASIPDGNQFCTACGTPVGATAAPPPQPGPTAPPAWTPIASSAPAQPAWTPVAASAGTPPVYGQPVPQRSGGAVKVILIVVGAFVGLGILCVALVMFGLWRVSRAVHVSNDGNVRISTPQGTLTAGSNASVSASDLGIDIYPGATRHEGGLQITTAKGSTLSAVFSTDDPMDKVVSFYKDKMGQGISVYQSDQGAVLTMNSADNKSSVVVTISADTHA
ncbi:MAG: zinc ribbon domain-containing protein, partial [Acidobacteriaceae bacterium]